MPMTYTHVYNMRNNLEKCISGSSVNCNKASMLENHFLTWASVKTRNAYISASGANPRHWESWLEITPATNVPWPRLSFNVSSLVQLVLSCNHVPTRTYMNLIITLKTQNARDVRVGTKQCKSLPLQSLSVIFSYLYTKKTKKLQLVWYSSCSNI